jgi:hypothetical protein
VIGLTTEKKAEKTKLPLIIITGVFPGWEHDPYPWNWEFQRFFVTNWEKMHD